MHRCRHSLRIRCWGSRDRARAERGVVMVLERLREQARRLKAQTYAIYLVARDPRTPWFAKLLAAIVVGYALSPIDLIPDFIPVLGYLDDLLLIPLGLWLVVRLVPEAVLADAQERAASMIENELPPARGAAIAVVAVWLLLAAFAIGFVYRLIR
jgi:uncharacterized membrane protein YkvA (DUF1232 family)